MQQFIMTEPTTLKSSGLKRKASLNVTFCVKKKRDETYSKVSKILQKSEKERSKEENELLSSSTNIVKIVSLRLEKRKQLQARSEEFEDSAELLKDKCYKLAAAIRHSKHLVVYSGAGVSTAASIPDYRGTNGIWTRLQQGKDIGNHDLSAAEPTAAHMALYALYKVGILKYIVSQNCDGLHLRSGVPRKVLSEVHGNMNLEVCTDCNIQVWRSFDVTEYTARYAHQTARLCSSCSNPLRDTIVHFGERGNLPWPINWNGACQAAKQADMILCMGSSLKVLKKYPWLWGMDKPVRKRPQLYIVNLQWTPKDDQATLKINGKCDDVMQLVMKYLNLQIPDYDRRCDPIFHHATQLHSLEEHTISTPMLVKPDVKPDISELPGGFQPISQQNIDDIVSGIKKEEGIWRPFGREIIVSNKPLKAEDIIVMPSHSGFSVDIFDQVYQEVAKKILKETNNAYYKSLYEEPLDLSKPKVECEYCYENYRDTLCQFYLKREPKVPSKGRPCYCCDSDDDVSETTQDGDSKKGPSNPGWFGKGYKKRMKKKR